MNKIKVDSMIFLVMHKGDDNHMRQIKGSLEIAIPWQPDFALERHRQRANLAYAKSSPEVETVVRITTWKIASAIIPLQ